ncbi:phosphodiester glycosidase family protein [Bacteroides sp.]|uniref:phosphodiester glycosidase family protein n=1 Tax=Bacteroides sp. TaxID=29523 RepID=UPI00261D84B5|nr:phosphodiester glycosidase family protein [Bacteroides sp.]MDD3037026.1 phosphodiester glycosidase family protein [Bacteroides sp.]
MKRYFAFSILLVFLISVVNAQTKADSIAIVTAPWQIVETQKGIVHKRVVVLSLYQGVQSINLLEINPETGKKVGIAVNEKMDKISFSAANYQAIAAVNGSYFNMKEGNSVCFLKTDCQLADTTTLSEFKLRVTGAVYIKKGKLKLIPWNRVVEKMYKGQKGMVLASGPLMLKDGTYYNWSMCNSDFINTKHPRSAVCITKEGKILFVTVDGRFEGLAEGMNIPELAHLLKVLGAKDAINLDGGGSTTLWLSGASDNGIVNYPCDNGKFDHEGERKVANFLYVYE